MTATDGWTDWLLIQNNGATGTPRAEFIANVVAYPSVSWSLPRWRYNRQTSEVQFAGLVAVNMALSGANNLPFIYVYLDDPEMPWQPRDIMTFGMSNLGDASAGQPYRLQFAKQPGYGALFTVNLTTYSGWTSGRWINLDGLKHSMADNDPYWYPWRDPFDGLTTDGVTFSWGTGNTDWGWYDANWYAQVRYSRDFADWQWRGLVRRKTAVASSPAVQPMVTIGHPGPRTAATQLMVGITNQNWAGGQGETCRIDVQPHASGHTVSLIAPKAFSPVWYVLPPEYSLGAT